MEGNRLMARRSSRFEKGEVGLKVGVCAIQLLDSHEYSVDIEYIVNYIHLNRFNYCDTSRCSSYEL